MLLLVQLLPAAVPQQALLHLPALLVELLHVLVVLLGQGGVGEVPEEDHGLPEDELVLVEPGQEVLKGLHDLLGKGRLVEVVPDQPLEPPVDNFVV